MSIIGKTLAHYSITAEIGKGGMGEVYQAKDTKLGRDVAIKVLPEEFAKDTNRVARFQREAKLLASLNHPNIAAIYGLEESDGTNFLVMEFVEGITLDEQIKSSPIPIEEALKLVLQIAEALEAAHEKGVIHRDLKPANIKVTPDGKAKVLDFGLAKAFEGKQADLNLSNSPTLSQAATMQGVILGTAAYMSPEQAKGKTVDKRTDIWAFGIVLLEMITGQPAFKGDEISEILASVIKGDTNLDLLPTNLHPRVLELLSRCLQKDLRKRYADIADARYEIEQVLADPGGISELSASEETRMKFRQTLIWISLSVGLIIIVGVIIWYLRSPLPQQVVHFDYDLSDEQLFSQIDSANVLAVSPDGNEFVYSTTQGLYLRSINELNARIIPGTEEDTASPFFSSDGQWIGYWSITNNKLKKVHINGGTTAQLGTERPMGYAYWSDNEFILYAGPNGIMRISTNGGEPETLIEIEDKLFFAPRLLPDGESVIFTIEAENGYKIYLQSLESGERKFLINGSDAYYIPTGHLIYIVDYDLYAVPFNIKTLEVNGEGFLVLEGIYRVGPPQYAVANSGLLVYLPDTSNRIREDLVWVDHHGKEEAINAASRIYANPRISLVGDKIALQVWDKNNQNIWIWDLNREILSPLTTDNVNATNPLWTPDNQWVVFSRKTAGASTGIYRKASNGTGEIQHLYSQRGYQFIPQSWANDGNNLIASTSIPGIVNSNLGILSLEDNQWEPLLGEEYEENNPRISPNGLWMAYTSKESGFNEVYICSFPKVNEERNQISTDGGDRPVWSPDGRELFYRNGSEVMAVTVEPGRSLEVGKPRILFQGTYQPGWDVHPNGKKFLMMKPSVSTNDKSATVDPRPKINVILNWFEELKERVPVD